LGRSVYYYLKDKKEQTVAATLAFMLDWCDQQGRKVSVIEADNEILKYDLVRSELMRRRVKVEPSAPRTQAQNGGAERSGGVIKEKARAMRGKLPTMLWREITRAAVYLYNRSPRCQNRWKSPYEIFYGRKPGQEHLKAYSCKAFAMTPQAQDKVHRLQRLNPRAWIGYLVGYASSNIYRIWVPQENKVISTRDVTFDERQTFDGSLDTPTRRCA
jgi:hypothetical protein